MTSLNHICRCLFHEKITEKDNGKETVYENYTELSYIKEETGGIWEVELSQTDVSVDEN